VSGVTRVPYVLPESFIVEASAMRVLRKKKRERSGEIVSPNTRAYTQYRNRLLFLL
jgi:hypothetical protein